MIRWTCSPNCIFKFFALYSLEKRPLGRNNREQTVLKWVGGWEVKWHQGSFQWRLISGLCAWGWSLSEHINLRTGEIHHAFFCISKCQFGTDHGSSSLRATRICTASHLQPPHFQPSGVSSPLPAESQLQSVRLPELQAWVTACTTPALVTAYMNAVSLLPARTQHT
jgi:hypothetical protein